MKSKWVSYGARRQRRATTVTASHATTRQPILGIGERYVWLSSRCGISFFGTPPWCGQRQVQAVGLRVCDAPVPCPRPHTILFHFFPPVRLHIVPAPGMRLAHPYIALQPASAVIPISPLPSTRPAPSPPPLYQLLGLLVLCSPRKALTAPLRA